MKKIEPDQVYKLISRHKNKREDKMTPIAAIDIDGTLCLEKKQWWEYATCIPIEGTKEAIDILKSLGHRIILYTSRFEADRKVTEEWLHKHNFSFDEIIFGKVRADMYIDSNATSMIELVNILYQAKKKDRMIIYKLQNKINGKIYIGQTKFNLSKRITEHIKEEKSLIYKALNKYGVEAFVTSVIDYAEDRGTLSEKEKKWIRVFNCKSPRGYNLTSGGEGLFNPSEEIREKMRVANLGRKDSEVTKEKHRKIMKGNTLRLGKKDSEGTKEKKRKAHIGKKLRKEISEEVGKKIGAANSKRVWSKESREKSRESHKKIKRMEEL
jgi:group I intron endonuclease